MQRFLVGHGEGGTGEQLVERCLAQIGELPEAVNFGFVYATDALATELGAILTKLRQRTGIAHWTGTVGVGISATSQEYYEQPALAVMLAAFPVESFKVIPTLSSNTKAFMHDASSWLADDEFHFGLLHADPTNQRSLQLMNDLAAQVAGAFFVGGLTSSQGLHAQIANGVSAGGISGVLFSSKVPVVTSHTQGCTPIGISHRITRCERNVLIELDGRPALEVFKEDVGQVIANDLQRASGYIFAGFPIAGSDTGDYLVRNLMGIDLERKLVAVAELLTSESEIMFCRRDGNSAREDLLRMLRDLKRRMGPTPKGAVYYSCLGRGRQQFGEQSAELKFIQSELGDLPLVGFFANGEIFHNRLYAYTGVLTIFC
ncbi:MAG: histidine kinase [Gammaproteobacteria bacterium]|nr:histidine kinase [Gammaproteobacteria bacterium]